MAEGLRHGHEKMITPQIFLRWKGKNILSTFFLHQIKIMSIPLVILSLQLEKLIQ